MKSDLENELQKFGFLTLSVEAVFAKALRNGGELAELFFEETISTRVFYENQRVDRLGQGMDRGVGLRILFEGRSVYGYTTDLTDQGLMRLAISLSESLQEQVSQIPLVNPLGSQVRPSSHSLEWRLVQQNEAQIARYEIQESPRASTLAQKIGLAQRAEGAARRELPDARQVTSVVMDSLRKILVLNSDGLIAPDSKTYVQAFVQVVGEKEGRIETAYVSDGGYVGMEFFDQVTPESLGQKASQRVKILLTAKPAPSGTMPVVISSEAGGTMIHEAVGHGLEADLACNGHSVYQGKLGQCVASPLITVIDDGTLPGKRGSYRFDDEGTASRSNLLIENGILKSYLVDRLSAMKFDLMATGNGRRESFRHQPIVRMTNTYIAPGADEPESILKDTSWGVFVKAMGGGQVNTVTGDFVFAVTEGYLIEKGKLGSPIRGATLVGNGPKVLARIDRVGTDLGFSTGTCGKNGQAAPVTDAQPTLRIPELTVGGEVPISDYWTP